MIAKHPAPQCASARGCELFAYLGTRRLPSAPALDQRVARLVDERLHLGRLTAEGLGDLDMGEVAQLGEHERGALVNRERSHV